MRRNQNFVGEKLLGKDMRKYGMLAIIGIVILTAGIVMCMVTKGFGPKVETPSYPYPVYTSTSREIIYIGAVFYAVGIAVLSASLISGAIFEKKFDQYARLGMLIAAGLILGLLGYSLNALVSLV